MWDEMNYSLTVRHYYCSFVDLLTLFEFKCLIITSVDCSSVGIIPLFVDYLVD